MTYLFTHTLEVLHHYGYWGVAIIVFLESGTVFALPGDSLLFTAGIFANEIGFNLYLFIPIVFVSTFLGGILGYIVGRYIEKLHHYAFFRTILKQEYIDRAHAFFEKHGKPAIIFSRFLAVVRTFMPIAAGIARMNFKSFVRYSLVSSVLWSVIVPISGFLLGKKVPEIQNYLSLIAASIIVASLFPFFVGVWRKWKNHKDSQAS